MWQELYEELKGRGFMVIAVALDSRAGDPEKWIEAARPSYVCLIDRDHRLAELYNMVNVPQAVWIDERGRIVRPTESAGAYEGFRKMDRATRQMPEDVARITADAKATYVNAIRDWVLNGPASKHVFDPEGARARVTDPHGARRPRPRGVPTRAVPDPQGTCGRGRSMAGRGERAPPGILGHLAPAGRRQRDGAGLAAGLLGAGRRAR